MGYFRQRLDVGDQAARIGQAFGIDGAGIFINQRLEAFDIGGVGPFHVPVELGEAVVELVDRTAIKLACRHDVLAGAHQRVQRQQLRGMTGRHGKAGAAAFQCRHALFEHRGGGVHQAGIDVAEDLQVEQGCRMVGIFEHIGRGLVDRGRARARCRIRRGAGMNAEGIESVIGHFRSPYWACSIFKSFSMRRTQPCTLGYRARSSPASWAKRV